MPIIKSAKKRVRTARNATIRNSKTKRIMRTALKQFAKKATPASHSGAQSVIDTAVKKGLMSKNKAARIKKQLSATAKAAGVKQSATKKPAAKVAAKKATVAKKASPVKKAAPKKTSSTKKK
jgi:small subunit ribosomal protein S20